MQSPGYPKDLGHTTLSDCSSTEVENRGYFFPEEGTNFLGNKYPQEYLSPGKFVLGSTYFPEISTGEYFFRGVLISCDTGMCAWNESTIVFDFKRNILHFHRDRDRDRVCKHALSNFIGLTLERQTQQWRARTQRQTSQSSIFKKTLLLFSKTHLTTSQRKMKNLQEQKGILRRLLCLFSL